MFAGLGGFHLAFRRLGHRSVWACEIDESLRSLYKKNFDILPAGDIRTVEESDIPPHDVLCAGFPCQPFSKAGRQLGTSDPDLGDLYSHILRVVKHHLPAYVLLENVANLEMHRGGRTWRHIRTRLKSLGYHVEIRKLSPHQFGVPQIRDRVYIVAARHPLDNFSWPEPWASTKDLSIRSVLTRRPASAVPISKQVQDCLDIWQQFLDQLPKDEKVPHPLWSMEFGATYPYEKATPYSTPVDELREFKGSFGVSLADVASSQEAFERLPSHARTQQFQFPTWKIGFIKKNRDFYERHKKWLDAWIPRIQSFPSSLQKLEWNCQGERNRTIRKYVLQMRPSGVRVKRRTTAPSLVASTMTQVPIIGWEERYMTPRECARLQSMKELRHLPERRSAAYAALGNAVNVHVVELIADQLVGCADDRSEDVLQLVSGNGRETKSASTVRNGIGESTDVVDVVTEPVLN